MAGLELSSVPCFVQPDIQGEVIPDAPEGFPFGPKLLDTITENLPVVVSMRSWRR